MRNGQDCSEGHLRPGLGGRRVPNRGILTAVLILAVLLLTCPTAGRIDSDAPVGDAEVGSPWGGIWITITQESVELSEEIPLPPQGGVPVPTGLQGLVEFEVVSPLPNWEVRVQYEPICGSCGIIEENCFLVRGPATEGEFVSVCGSPVVARGSGPAPALDLWLELQARPEWTHGEGFYEGLLHLVPIAEEVVPVSEFPGPNGRSGFAGGRASVPATLNVEALTVVMTSVPHLNIDTGVIPGRYYAVPDLDVLVATNEENWEVRLEGTPFMYEAQLIELERLEWAELDSGGEPGPWTLVGDDNTLMSSCDGCGVFSANYRMALEIDENDRAGNYTSYISLVGAHW